MYALELAARLLDYAREFGDNEVVISSTTFTRNVYKVRDRIDDESGAPVVVLYAMESERYSKPETARKQRASRLQLSVGLDTESIPDNGPKSKR